MLLDHAMITHCDGIIFS